MTRVVVEDKHVPAPREVTEQINRLSRTLQSPLYGPTSARPSAASVSPGAPYYDTTITKPIWSDGTNWRDATGTIV